MLKNTILCSLVVMLYMSSHIYHVVIEPIPYLYIITMHNARYLQYRKRRDI